METSTIVILVVIVLIIIWFYSRANLKPETFINPVGWAPTGADLVEICGRNPMYGGGRCPWWGGLRGGADLVEIGRRGEMYGTPTN